MTFKDLVQTPTEGTARDTPKEPQEAVVKSRFKIAKANEDKMLAFGWASVAVRTDGEQITDWQDDMIDPEDLEEAVYDYVQLSGDGGEMHERGGVAQLVESVIFTKEKMKAMGIKEGEVPEGWWIGFRVTDPDVWDKVKDGTYNMFSIEGTAQRVPVEEDSQE